MILELNRAFGGGLWDDNKLCYSQTWLYRIWLYRTTYISLLIPENSAKLSRDYYTGTLFITDFFLSRPYKFFVSGISRFNCIVRESN
jgi:hypothetical protein